MNNIMGPLDYFRARVLGSDHDPLGVQPFTTYEDGSTDNPAPPPPPAAYVPLGAPLSGLFGSGDESVRVPYPAPPTPDETARMTFMPMLHPDQRPVG